MDPIYYCGVCSQLTCNYTRLCRLHTYQSFMEKCEERMEMGLQRWKEGRKHSLGDAGETEKQLFGSEETFGRILLAVWSEAKDREKAFNLKEYFSINIECKLYTKKFKSLRLPKIGPYFTHKISDKAKKTLPCVFHVYEA
ncbi:unnamed protein product [Moneuplotes crassus]|uniref:Uncharacterized protein n=1 Tax=Euplotes crassus TaxID=5936 RepID=A0AAD1Y3J8_EUPCR|nr:unnamed protein product [Moneuplotes crassus]